MTAARARQIAARARAIRRVEWAGGQVGTDPLVLSPRLRSTSGDQALGQALGRIEDGLRRIGDTVVLENLGAHEDVIEWYRGDVESWVATLAMTLFETVWAFDREGVVALWHAVSPELVEQLRRLVVMEDSFREWAAEVGATWRAVEDASSAIGERWREWLP